MTSRALLGDGGDGRSAWARRYRDLVAEIAQDLGGIATLSEVKVAMLRRFAALSIECERIEADLASGRPADVDQLGKIAGHARRIAEVIGVNRVAKDATPDLASIVQRHGGNR